MFGVSLYQQKNNELRREGRRPFDAKELLESVREVAESPYLSAVPCSWGGEFKFLSFCRWRELEGCAEIEN